MKIGDRVRVTSKCNTEKCIGVITNILNDKVAVKFTKKEIKKSKSLSSMLTLVYSKKNLQMVEECTTPPLTVNIEKELLDKIINSGSECVQGRLLLVENRYRLSEFVNDESTEVRMSVADQRYGLEILVNDRNPLVRLAVARQGFDVNSLVFDKDDRVSEEAHRFIRKENEKKLLDSQEKAWYD